MFHVRKIALYFAILLAWLVYADIADAIPAGQIVRSSLWLIGGAAVVIGLLSGIALLIQRSTVYTITTRRVVMRFGMAFPMAFNLPFRRIRSAGLRRYADGSGDIPLVLGEGDKLAYAVLWPHARPWRFSRPEPMLRGLADAQQVAEILARALADDMQTRAPATGPDASLSDPSLSNPAAPAGTSSQAAAA